MANQEVICIGCPLGCRVRLTINSAGNIENISGNQCKEGKQHAASEYLHPERVLTATVLAEGEGNRLIPVRTDKAVPKKQLKELMCATVQIRVKPPIKVGQIIKSDVLPGVNLVATGTI